VVSRTVLWSEIHVALDGILSAQVVSYFSGATTP
jgi:hypothetical protein